MDNEGDELTHDKILETQIARNVVLTVPAASINEYDHRPLNHVFGDQVVEGRWDRNVLRVALAIEQHDKCRRALARDGRRVDRESPFLSKGTAEHTVRSETAGGHARQSN